MIKSRTANYCLYIPVHRCSKTRATCSPQYIMSITRSIQRNLRLHYHQRNLSKCSNHLKVLEVQFSGKSRAAYTRKIKASTQRLHWIKQEDKINVTHDEGSADQLPLHRTIRENMNLLIRQMLPYDYPRSVDFGYRKFAHYQFIGATSSSAACVLSTQCLLHAVGLTSGTALGLSAALNWVIKDGLGQVGGILFASYLGNSRAFDSDPKKWCVRSR